jgi:rfaE bifunctional protein kinase chain/domain
MKLDFSDIKVLLIGDFMIDHYIIGTSTRMSPEAPVPIVIPEKEYSIPGGAGNVAMNLSSMGANITCIGAVGNDIWGQKLIEILNSNNINTKYIELIKDYTTTLKQRVYSNGIQIARVDQEEYLDWNPNLSENFDYADYDVIILSDYSKGVLIRPWFFEPKGIDVILDPKNKKWKHLFKHSNIITPNLNELKKISGMNITDNHSILNACNQLIKDNNFDYIIAKKGNQGMTIVGKDNFVKHIEAHYVENPDVTGAGDTVIAVLSIVYAKTNDIEFSAKFANAAASIVVGKLGTATTTVEEIKKLLLK